LGVPAAKHRNLGAQIVDVDVRGDELSLDVVQGTLTTNTRDSF
jgi:hypothetical protein